MHRDYPDANWGIFEYLEDQLWPSFWEDGVPVDQIAGVMVEVFSTLEKGTKTGREVERRVMVWKLVNVWVSKWAEWVV